MTHLGRATRKAMRRDVLTGRPVVPKKLVVPAQAGPARTTDGPRERVFSAPLDIVEEWGQGSFPASDPPANW